jgi:hypothetical protein
MQNEDIRNIFDNADTDAANNPVFTVDKATSSGAGLAYQRRTAL